ncbi:MAG: hypothetical protein QM487_01160 [Candidatus Marithrix sp.]
MKFFSIFIMFGALMISQIVRIGDFVNEDVIAGFLIFFIIIVIIFFIQMWRFEKKNKLKIQLGEKVNFWSDGNNNGGGN